MTQGNIVIDAHVRAAIEDLIYEHAWLVDNHRSDDLYKLYTEDGKLQGPTMTCEGRDAIRKYGADRAKMTTRQSRHVSSNLRLSSFGQCRVRGTHTVTLFRYDRGGYGPANPCAVADLHDIYIRSADGRWLIEERRIEVAFESEEHRKPNK